MRIVIFAGLAILASALPANLSRAEQPETGQSATDVDVRVGPARVQTHTAESRSNRDEVTDYVRRAGQIAGIEVRGRNGQELGKIEDLVFDIRSGTVEYAALSCGGFLGIGDKLIAVPYRELAFHTDTEGNTYAVLRVDEKSLKGVTGFDPDKWPNMANPQWRQQTDSRFPRHSSEQGTREDGTRHSEH